jgi:hypothetical protein
MKGLRLSKRIIMPTAELTQVSSFRDQEQPTPRAMDYSQESFANSDGNESQGLSQLQNVVHSLRSRRAFLDNERAKIDAGLEGLAGEIGSLLGVSRTRQVPADRKVPRKATRGRGRPPGKQNKQDGTGTDVLVNILRKHKGKMPSGELARLGAEHGLRSAHSSIQSLKNRKRSPRISLANGFAELVER